MDIVAHGLWAAAGGIAGKRRGFRISLPWLVFWAGFPDILAFGPTVAVGLWMLLTTGAVGRHVHPGLPLYPLGHSLVTFATVFGLSWLALRRPPLALLGWLSHILIDIPTHSYSYYATSFLWPFSDFGIDGLPWWTRWFLVATYAGLAVVYALMWRAGWLRRGPKVS